MFKTLPNLPTVENTHGHQHVICWKSTLAGLLISIMAFLLLTALGAGIFGSIAQSAVENEKGGTALFTGAGVYLGLSVVVALFIGSYFTIRISGFITSKVGMAHGTLLASIFFILFVLQAGSVVGALSKGVGKVVQGVGQGTTAISASPQVQDAIQNVLGATPLKNDPKEVVQGLSLRLLSGDTDSAKTYFAYQTGLSESDVDAKIAQLKTNFEAAVKTAGEKTADAVADAGWSLLMTFAVGLLAAIIGGMIGAESNFGRPLVESSSSNNHYVAPARI